LVLQGNDKPRKKIYYHHSGHYGHLKRRTGEDLLQRRPEFVLYTAVYGMIPKGALCNRQMKKLKIFPGASHSHKAQNPEPYAVKTHVRAHKG
jgi:large subunit ribosomal protein L13